PDAPQRPPPSFPTRRSSDLGVFQPRTVDDGGLAGGLRDAVRVPQHVAAPTSPDVQVDAAHAKGVHFAVQLPDERDRLFDIAVGADALDAHPLAHELQFRHMVPFRRTDAHADYPLQTLSPPCWPQNPALPVSGLLAARVPHARALPRPCSRAWPPSPARNRSAYPRPWAKTSRTRSGGT